MNVFLNLSAALNRLMPDTSLLLLIGLEIAVVLLLLMGLVLLRARNLSKINVALENKVIELRQSLKSVRGELKSARLEAAQARSQSDYGELIDAQISATRNHHLGLNPERDIVLDMAMDASAERRAASLRHAFLIAEKEAWLASDNGRDVDWGVLEGKLGQIIGFYEQPADTVIFAEADGLEALDLAGEITAGTPVANAEAAALREVVENQKRHIENLERFKKLFFDADDKWRKAGKQADQYRQEILALSRSLNVGDDFNALLENYNRVYVEFGSALAIDGEQPRGAATSAVEVGGDQFSVGRIVIANQEEMQRLRNMAVDQHKMILRLRQELEDAQTVEEKDRVIGELHKQLERHERFLKESDICTKQLENELERSLEENHALKRKVLEITEDMVPAPLANPDVEQVAAIIEDFTRQSGEMLNALEVLEAECSELRLQLKNAPAASGGDRATVDGLTQQLTAAQQELLNLQTQHIELEERYLELKTAAL
jgi:hypothetical protein